MIDTYPYWLPPLLYFLTIIVIMACCVGVVELVLWWRRD